MTQYQILLSVCFMTCALFSCSKNQSDQIQGDSRVDVRSVIQDQLGPRAKVIPNEEETYYLGILIEDLSTRYLVIDHSGAIVIKKARLTGNISWNDNESLKLEHRPEVLENKSSKPEELVEIIHIKAAM